MITRIVSDGDGEMMEGLESLLEAAVVTVRVCLLLQCASLVTWDRKCCGVVPARYGDKRSDMRCTDVSEGQWSWRGRGGGFFAYLSASVIL